MTWSMQKQVGLVLGAWLIVAGSIRANDFEAMRLDNWHQWRGPLANGVAPNAQPPLTWDASKNIKWKVAIPGSGTSTPIVWGDRIFLTTAIDTKRKPESAATPAVDAQAENEAPQPPDRSGSQRKGGRGGGFRGFGSQAPETLFEFIVLCLDRQTGDVRWKQIATEAVPHEGHHRDHGYASGSANTDGDSLFVTFGSRGIYCYDLEGNLRWKRDLGKMKIIAGFGEGSSPAAHGDSLIVNWDHENDSFIVSLDKATGQDKWRVARDEGSTWNTPLIVEHKGVTQVIVNGTKRTRSYDFTSGELIWECGGQASNPVPSPVAANGIVYCMTGYRGYALKAIPLDAKGDITDTDQVLWERNSGTPYVPSPLLYDGLLYFTRSNNGILTCVKADTGEEVFANERLGDVRNMYASITYADGKVYLTSREGNTVVIRHGPTLEILATNELGEGIDASPVFVGQELFLRSAQHLYCIVEK